MTPPKRQTTAKTAANLLRTGSSADGNIEDRQQDEEERGEPRPHQRLRQRKLQPLKHCRRGDDADIQQRRCWQRCQAT